MSRCRPTVRGAVASLPVVVHDDPLPIIGRRAVERSLSPPVGGPPRRQPRSRCSVLHLVHPAFIDVSTRSPLPVARSARPRSDSARPSSRSPRRSLLSRRDGPPLLLPVHASCSCFRGQRAMATPLRHAASLAAARARNLLVWAVDKRQGGRQHDLLRPEVREVIRHACLSVEAGGSGRVSAAHLASPCRSFSPGKPISVFSALVTPRW